MKTLNAAARLTAAIQTLHPTQGRIARRNARRRVAGAIRALKLAVNQEFPPVKKVKPTPPKPKRAERLKLSPVRGFYMDSVRLFLRIWTFTYDQETPQIHAWEGAKLLTKPREKAIYVKPSWSANKKWKQVVHYLAQLTTSQYGDYPASLTAMRQLYTKFWTEPIPVADLQLAAEHRLFLESDKRQRQRTIRTTPTNGG